MTQQELLREFRVLPAEAQRQVADLIALLGRNQKVPSHSVTKPAGSEEKFFGIWKGRPDMDDSSGWVRRIRNDEREPC